MRGALPARTRARVALTARRRVHFAHATLYLFNRVVPHISEAMLRKCSPNAQRRIEPTCTVKVADKHPKVVDIRMPSGRRVTLKLPSAELAREWCQALDYCIVRHI